MLQGNLPALLFLTLHASHKDIDSLGLCTRELPDREEFVAIAFASSGRLGKTVQGYCAEPDRRRDQEQFHRNVT